MRWSDCLAIACLLGAGSSRRSRRAVAALCCVLMGVVPARARAQVHLRLATTTSTEQSGLLAVVLPPFEQRFHLVVDVIAVGSGKALKLAENGDVDVVLSHAPELEEKFIAAGFGVNRREVMYNDFVIVGPAADPAALRGARGAADAFKKIDAARALFISRGDESGTHQKEKEIWRVAGISPGGSWYQAAGIGMGEVLLMASEREAYALADRGTFLTYRQRDNLAVLVEGDPALFNPYTVIAVNPARHAHARYIEAMQLIAWLTSSAGQSLIAGFTRGGQRVFQPTAIPQPANDRQTDQGPPGKKEPPMRTHEAP